MMHIRSWPCGHAITKDWPEGPCPICAELAQLGTRAERAESSLKAAGEAFEMEAEKVKKAVVEIKRMDCDCAGEGVGSLGGCFRCRALNELSTFGWDFAALPSPTKASPPEPVNTWYCGCGHTNGCNLATCAACSRPPGGWPEEQAERYQSGGKP